MSKSLYAFTISTNEKQSFTNLDRYLGNALAESGVKDGIMVVYCPHTTAAITINENADPDVKTDLKRGLDETFPNKAKYIHMEGNSDGHMKSSVVGASETLIISDGQLVLGTWQSVYLCTDREYNFFRISGLSPLKLGDKPSFLTNLMDQDQEKFM